MKIAVIGAGISGLSCAWLLASHAKHVGGVHQVTLFEKNNYAGGHTNTVDVTHEGITYPVDTGFLVCNDWTYPNFLPMLKHLDVATAPSDMSFGIKLTDSAGQSHLEWCGSDNLSTVFAQPANLLRPRFWGMLADLLRFNREAAALSNQTQALTGTLGQYLLKHGYGRAFRDWYLVPMAACIWSTPTKRIDDFPLATFISFCANHGLISVNNRPQWRTVAGGARNYVQKLITQLEAANGQLILNADVTRVTRSSTGALVESKRGVEMFDHVVMACHSDETLKLLSDARADERDCLAQIQYQPNTAVLHTDASVLPDRKRAWAAWNYHAHYKNSAAENDSPVSLTYLLNKLQPIPFKSPVMVTMNPLSPIAEEKVIKRIAYAHPMFMAESITAKRALRQLQGKQNTWFAGAWTRYGFHEDGLMSGIAVARSLGAATPWQTNTPAANDLAAPYPGVDTP
jgi:uncharacterized protein